LSRRAAWCQSSPYSPPPRIIACATAPPRSSHASDVAEKRGRVIVPYAPYALRIVGVRAPSAPGR